MPLIFDDAACCLVTLDVHLGTRWPVSMSGRRDWSNGVAGGSSSKRQREEDGAVGGQKRRVEYEERGVQLAAGARVRSEVRGRDDGSDRKNLNIESAAVVNRLQESDAQSKCVCAYRTAIVSCGG